MKLLDKILHPNKKVRVIDCSCGKTYEVVTNLYDNSDSGCGGCECGKCVTYIN